MCENLVHHIFTMPVNRRTFIKSAGVTTTIAAIAGCLSVDETTTTTESSGDDSDTEDNESSETTTTTVEPGEATYWHARTEADKDALEADIDTFHGDSAHSIKPVKIADFVPKSNSAIPAGDGPHLFEWAHDLGGDYWERGFLTDQSDNVDIDLESTFTKPGASAATWDARRETPALKEGDLSELEFDSTSEQAVAFERIHDEGSVVVALHFGNGAASVELPGDVESDDLLTGETVNVDVTDSMESVESDSGGVDRVRVSIDDVLILSRPR